MATYCRPVYADAGWLEGRWVASVSDTIEVMSQGNAGVKAKLEELVQDIDAG